jgi:hypothetical protein
MNLLEDSWDSAVCRATGYGLDERGGRSSSPGRVKNLLFSRSSRPVLGPIQDPIKWVPGAFSQGVKRSEREGDNPEISSEVKKMWIYTPLPHTASWRGA